MFDIKEGRHFLRKRFWGRLLLGLCSFFYGAMVLTRRVLYSQGILRSHRLGAKVICIGNLTAGGTGKSPAVLLAAQGLRRRNQNIAILSRGYGRTGTTSNPCVLIEDNEIPWTVCGDEPWMMHRSLHGLSVPILVNPDRVRAGKEAMAYFHSRVLLLDDGFQHHKLKRDIDIVLINARDPFGGRRLLPLGDLREPTSGLQRAHLVVLTHVDQVSRDEIRKLRDAVHEIHPDVPIAESVHKADFLFDLKRDKKIRMNRLSGRVVSVFSGLGDPGGFEGLIEAAGAEIDQKWRFPDHYPYTDSDLQAIENVRRKNGERVPVVTTFKDFPRLPEGWRNILSGEVLALGVKLDIVKGRNLWNSALFDGLPTLSDNTDEGGKTQR